MIVRGLERSKPVGEGVEGTRALAAAAVGHPRHQEQLRELLRGGQAAHVVFDGLAVRDGLDRRDRRVGQPVPDEIYYRVLKNQDSVLVFGK